MKLLEIKREGENLYLITFEVKSIFGKSKKHEKHIFLEFATYYNFSDSGKFIGFDLNKTVASLVPQLKGYEPIIIK